MAPLAVPIAWAVERPSPDEERVSRADRDRARGPAPWLSFQSLRDPVLFIAGLAGIVHETVVAAEPRWSLLLVFGAMMALPIPLRADEVRRNGGGGT